MDFWELLFQKYCGYGTFPKFEPNIVLPSIFFQGLFFDIIPNSNRCHESHNSHEYASGRTIEESKLSLSVLRGHRTRCGRIYRGCHIVALRKLGPSTRRA